MEQEDGGELWVSYVLPRLPLIVLQPSATQATNLPTYKYIPTYLPTSYVLLRLPPIFLQTSATQAAYLPMYLLMYLPTQIPMYLPMYLNASKTYPGYPVTQCYPSYQLAAKTPPDCPAILCHPTYLLLRAQASRMLAPNWAGSQQAAS